MVVACLKYSHEISGETKEKHEKSVRIAGILAYIRTECL